MGFWPLLRDDYVRRAASTDSAPTRAMQGSELKARMASDRGAPGEAHRSGRCRDRWRGGAPLCRAALPPRCRKCVPAQLVLVIRPSSDCDPTRYSSSFVFLLASITRSASRTANFLSRSASSAACLASARAARVASAVLSILICTVGLFVAAHGSSCGSPVRLSDHP